MSAMLSIHAILSAGVGSNLKTDLSMDGLVEKECTKERPFKCASSGACCRVSEFCYSGLCESCFPLHLQKDKRLAWCRSIGQYNTSAMRSPMCRLACQDVFNSTELANVDDNVPPKTAASRDDSSSGLDTVKALCGTILVLVVIVIALVLYVVIEKKKSANSGEFECCNVIRVRASQFVCCKRKETQDTGSPTPAPNASTTAGPPPNPGSANDATRSNNTTNTPPADPRPSVENGSTAGGGAEAGPAPPLESNESQNGKLSVAVPPGQSKVQSPADPDVPNTAPVDGQSGNENTALTWRDRNSPTELSPSSPDSDQENRINENTALLAEHEELPGTVNQSKQRALSKEKKTNPGHNDK